MVKRDTRRIKVGNEVESDWGEDSVITLASSEDVTLKSQRGHRNRSNQPSGTGTRWARSW